MFLNRAVVAVWRISVHLKTASGLHRCMLIFSLNIESILLENRPQAEMLEKTSVKSEKFEV